MNEIIKEALRKAAELQKSYRSKGFWLVNGDPPAPTTNESTDAMMAALIKNFPDLIDVQIGQVPKVEQELLRVAKDISPQFAELQLDQFEQTGPRFNEIGDRINRESALRQAAADRDVVAGPGRDLVAEARRTAEVFDPEFFATRSSAADQISKLFGSIDLNGLSGSEASEVERGLNRSTLGRGTVGVPSAIETLGAANTFGSALQAKRNALQQAIGTATQFLTPANSGVDAFQVATGRPSRPNQGAGLGTNIEKASSVDAVFGAGQNLTNNIAQFQQQQTAVNADRRDVFDRVTEGVSAVGSL